MSVINTRAHTHPSTQLTVPHPCMSVRLPSLRSFAGLWSEFLMNECACMCTPVMVIFFFWPPTILHASWLNSCFNHQWQTHFSHFVLGLSVIISALTTGPWIDPSPQLSPGHQSRHHHLTVYVGTTCWPLFPQRALEEKRGHSDADGLWCKHAGAMAFSDAWTWGSGKVSLFFTCFASNMH